ncbi:P-loop NTPase family protein [Clostridium sp. Marseille-QA1073]
MKIYIVGSVSSGKSTLAKKLSETLEIPYHSLDEIVHIPDKSAPWCNRKREVEERDNLFYSVIKQRDWIIEDVCRPCFKDGLKAADIIVLLEISKKIRNYRIIKRWIKQRLGIEKCIYTPSFEMLKSMLKWAKNYDLGKDKLKDRISIYKEKLIILRNKRDINNFIKTCITLIK